jgi:hypothetical protein
MYHLKFNLNTFALGLLIFTLVNVSALQAKAVTSTECIQKMQSYFQTLPSGVQDPSDATVIKYDAVSTKNQNEKCSLLVHNYMSGSEHLLNVWASCQTESSSIGLFEDQSLSSLEIVRCDVRPENKLMSVQTKTAQKFGWHKKARVTLEIRGSRIFIQEEETNGGFFDFGGYYSYPPVEIILK